MIIIAGLGNPDAQYEGTRHNIGFDALDLLHARLGAGRWKLNKGALTAEAKINGQRVLLAKPQKYMNRSGEVLAPLVRFYKIPTENLVVIYDDIDLPVGALRIRKSGGPGTHNGMRDIVLHLGEGFPRIRIGIGKPEFGDLAAYVLGKPRAEDAQAVQAAAGRAAEAVEAIVQAGIERAMGKYNIQ